MLRVMARAPIKFDRKATILIPAESIDSDGGPATTYLVGQTLWCHRHDLTSRETRSASSLRSDTVAVFTFRYFTGLTPKHRIECEGRTYNIEPPKELGRRQFLEVEASDVPNQ